MKDFDLNLLRALHALLESGSVTAAAQRMHLSVPAMSHTLARLREVMGDPLLVRAGRNLVPTPRALELKEPVARLLEGARALVVPQADQSLETVARTFVVRAPEGIVVVYSAALAAALHQAMPLSSLHFVPEAHGDVGALREGRIDLDIGSFRTRDPEVQSVEFSRQPLMVAIHPNAAPKRKLTAKTYAALKHVAVAPRQHEPSPVDEALEALGLTRTVLLTLPSAHAALVAAARGELTATVPERIAQAMAPRLGLQLLKLPFAVAADPVLMAWHPRQANDPAHRWLRECVLRLRTDPSLAKPQLLLRKQKTVARKA